MSIEQQQLPINPGLERQALQTPLQLWGAVPGASGIDRVAAATIIRTAQPWMPTDPADQVTDPPAPGVATPSVKQLLARAPPKQAPQLMELLNDQPV